MRRQKTEDASTNGSRDVAEAASGIVQITWLDWEDGSWSPETAPGTLEVARRRIQKIPTRKLNDFFLPLIENYPPPAIKGKYVKIKYVTQMKNIPMFIFFCNMPQYVYENYIRFLENKMREHFDYTGVPIEIVMRKKE